jgi:hypothetical protein
MLNQELLDYFKKIQKETESETEREFAQKVVRELSYAVETDYLLGERWKREFSTGNKQASVTANVDVETKREITEFAKRCGVSVNRITKRALLEHMEANRWTD